MQRRKAVLVSSTRIPGETISYVQLSGVNADQSSVRARREGTHDKIFGALISSLMQMKFVGMTPPWSSAQRCAARQMDVTALAHWRDSAWRLAVESVVNKAPKQTRPATATERNMIFRLLMVFSSKQSMDGGFFRLSLLTRRYYSVQNRLSSLAFQRLFVLNTPEQRQNGCD